MHDKKIWTTREGIEIEVCKMSNEHISNAIVYVNKHYAEWVAHFGKKEVLDHLKNLKAELRYRKLIRINNSEEL